MEFILFKTRIQIYYNPMLCDGEFGIVWRQKGWVCAEGFLMRANRSNFTLGRHHVKHDVHLDGQIVALQRQDVQFEAHFI